MSYLVFGTDMMTPSNGNIFRVTGPLCGEFPSQNPLTGSFDVFFDLRLHKRSSEQSKRRWFETPWRPLWRHFTACVYRFISNIMGLFLRQISVYASSDCINLDTPWFKANSLSYKEAECHLSHSTTLNLVIFDAICLMYLPHREPIHRIEIESWPRDDM